MDSNDYGTAPEWQDLLASERIVILPPLAGTERRKGPPVEYAGPYGARCHIDPVRRNPRPFYGHWFMWFSYSCWGIAAVGLIILFINLVN
jgi:hypothetical protein